MVSSQIEAYQLKKYLCVYVCGLNPIDDDS